MTKRNIISCVIDNNPKFHMQGWNWIASLKSTGACDFLTPAMFHIGNAPLYFSDAMRFMGVELCSIESFGVGNAVYCNKLQQITPLLSKSADVYLLCDADLGFVSTPISVLDNKTIRAKVVDLPNPTPDKLQNLIMATALEPQVLFGQPTYEPQTPTHRFNCNGGLYNIPGKYFEILGSSWKKWARFCLGRSDILGNKTHHADQLGFMLAMIELRLPFSEISQEYNFPMHFGPEAYNSNQPVKPEILHYHHLLDNAGKVKLTSIASIDAQISQLNEALRSFDSLTHYKEINAAFMAAQTTS